MTPRQSTHLPLTDRLGLGLSALCVVHCLATSAAVALLASAGLLGNPLIHRVGLALAILVGAVALGAGTVRHGRTGPMMLGLVGLLLMGGGIAAPHGLAEAVLTVAGVSLLALAHWRNAVCGRGAIAGERPRA